MKSPYLSVGPVSSYSSNTDQVLSNTVLQRDGTSYKHPHSEKKEERNSLHLYSGYALYVLLIPCISVNFYSVNALVSYSVQQTLLLASACPDCQSVGAGGGRQRRQVKDSGPGQLSASLQLPLHRLPREWANCTRKGRLLNSAANAPSVWLTEWATERLERVSDVFKAVRQASSYAASENNQPRVAGEQTYFGPQGNINILNRPLRF